MPFYVRIEEQVPLAEIILSHFTRDQQAIISFYPKLNNSFLNNYAAKIDNIKTIEKKALLLSQQTAITQSLYAEAAQLVDQLVFVKDYFADANLDPSIVIQLIHDLRSHNIEGACNKIEALKQLSIAHLPLLMDQGMAADFPNLLDSYNQSMAEKNKDQKITIDEGVVRTKTNNSLYTDLYADTINIANKSKKVFRKTPIAQQYVISKIIKSMRSGNKPKPKSKPENPPLTTDL